MNIKTVIEMFEVYRDRGSIPRVHPDGFIQIDSLDEERIRYNLFAFPGIPHKYLSAQIHSHTFDYKSTILVGSLTNIIYANTIPNESGQIVFKVRRKDFSTNKNSLEQGATKEDIYLPDKSDKYNLKAINCEYVKEGDKYHFPAGVLHTVNPHGLCVTSLEITKPDAHRFLIAHYSDRIEHDGIFDRYQIPKDKLWSIIINSLSELRAIKL